ncbi:MAG: PKD domain-containing protein [Bacteroidota bacterium]
MKKLTINKITQWSSFLLLAAVLILAACADTSQDFEIREIQYKIFADRTNITIGESVEYIDSSKNVANREWTFEGGDVSSSEQATVEVNYNEAGQFPAELVVDFQDGTTEERTLLINVEPLVEAAFAANKTTIIVGSSVTFENLSSEFADSLYWEFPGGSNITESDESNPTVRYDNVGTYSVTLNASRLFPLNTDIVTKTDLITVVDVAVISPVSSNMSQLGSLLTVTYDEELQALTDEERAKYSVVIDGAPADIADISLSDDNLSILITLATPATEGQTVQVEYAGDGFAATGSLLAGLVEFNITNTVVNLFTGNVDFENGGAGEFPPDWGTWNPDKMVNNNGFYEVIDTDAASGSKSLKFSYDGSGDRWILDNKSPATIIPNGNYRITFWAKSTKDGFAWDVRTIESGWAANDDPADFVLTTDWVQYSFDIVATDGGNLNRKLWWQTVDGSGEAFDIFVDGFKLYSLD